ncbi:MAG TPA: UDP-N-acetylmuramate dehydrogenase [Vicinamibacterales bacterium]|nr:UDP-N-acetylmuramate dehydrogenase [Vicinamibacterales bacterium]
MTALTEELKAVAGEGRVREHVPLGPLTTFGVGGPADWLVEPDSVEALQAVLRIATDSGEPVVLLGGGSNVLVADTGIRGVVVRPRLIGISQPSSDRVRAEAGVTINGLVRWLIGRGLAGLEAWAGTPGTVGGAIHGNAHYVGRNISDHVIEVGLWAPNAGIIIVPASEMGFGYDTSRLFNTGEVVVWADFSATTGIPDRLRATARESLAHRKRTQPLNLPSAGCVFQNPQPPLDRVPEGVPWSAGALVERAGLKGATEGAAAISTVHANFVVAGKGASASDVRILIERARDAVRLQCGVTLRDEIVYLGEW